MIKGCRGLSLARVSCLLLALICLLGQATAVQKSLAGVIDWHKANVGIPRADIQPVLSDGQVVLVTRSDVVAALSERNGTINWRIRLDSDDERISSVHVSKEDVLVVSGPTSSGSHAVIRSLSPLTGHLQWETQLPSSFDLSSAFCALVCQAQSSSSSTSRWLVALEGSRVFSLDSEDGSVQWEYDTDGALNGNIVDIAVTSTKAHLIAAINSLRNHQIGHLALDLSTGGTGTGTNEFKILDGSVNAGPAQVAITQNSTLDEAKLHFIAEDRTLRTATLGNDGTASKSRQAKRPTSAEAAATRPYVALRSLGLQGKGYLVAIDDAGGADVVTARKQDTEFLFNFDSDARQQRSPAIWNGYIGAEGGAYITRLFWSHGLGLANLHIYNVDHPDGYVYTGKTIPYQDAEHGIILDSAVAIKSAPPIIDTYSAVLVTSTGAVQYWRENKLLWSREESLAEVKAIKFVELPEKKSEDVVQVLREDEGVIGRLVRQSKAINGLPGFIAHFVGRFLGGTYTKTLSSTPLSPESLYRDAFGFQKLLLTATSTGKIFAMDSAHGNIIWSKLLGQSIGAESSFDVQGIWVVRGQESLEVPVVAVVAVDRSQTPKTVAFHVNAFTGEIIEPKPADSRPAHLGRHIFDGEPGRAFPLPVSHCKTHIRALAVANDDEIHLFPFCKKIEAGFRNISSHLHFSTAQTKATAPRLTGHTVANRITDGKFRLVPTFDHVLPAGSIVTSLARPLDAPVASLGRVLGDRSALYKYLNPHILAIASQQPTTSTALLQVVDETSGRVVYAANVTNVDEHGLQVTLTENWLVYAWSRLGDPMEGMLGNRLVSVELFEQGKTKSSEASAFDDSQQIEAVSKTFITSTAIRSLGMTTSLQGITARDLIYIDDRGQLNTVTRRLLDPRRPSGPPSKADKEEMLIPFNPLLPADPRRVVSHEADLMGISAVYAAPTLLESTGIILTTGLDIFSTRVQPSGTFDILSDAFNKVQLVLTIIGLLVGIAAAQPAVSRKLLRARWY